ncbi:MAG: D-alanyl-D-alanine carboxypeptidase, partial [Actinomycetota bacterium]
MLGARWRDRRTPSVILGSLVVVGALAMPASAAGIFGPAGPVLPPASTSAGTMPLPASVAAALEGPLSDDVLGPSVGAVVIDVSTGEVVFDQTGEQARSTASNEKVFTALSI